MAYPSVDQSFETSVGPLEGTVWDRADDGSIRGRNFHDADWYDIRVVHEWISTSDKNSIISDYASNKTSSVSWTYAADSTAYTCYYQRRPTVTPMNSTGTYWRVETEFVGKVT